MRLSALAAVVAGAGIAQVVAVPIRMILVSTSIQQEGSAGPLEHVRFGHPMKWAQEPDVARMTVGGGPVRGARHQCKGRMGKLRQKGVEISNAFRQALGWPLIEEHPQPHHRHHLKHPSQSNELFTTEHMPPLPVFRPAMEVNRPGDLPRPGNFKILPMSSSQQYRPQYHHRFRGGSFMTRVQYSLANLGRWEGRAVAFVLGCGIGVLIRMFTVLFIVLYRSIRGSRQAEQDEYNHIIIYDSSEVFEAPAQLPPPSYSYPVDEKIAVEADTKAAEPVTVETVTVEPVKTTEEDSK